MSKVILEAEPETVHCDFFQRQCFLKKGQEGGKPHRRATAKERDTTQSTLGSVHG